MTERLPSGWKKIEVSDAFHVGRGRVISKPEIQNNKGIYPVYSSQSKDKGMMGAIATYDFEGEYITWTTDGAYAGTVFYRNGRFNCTNVCGTLKSNNNFELSYQFVAEYLSTVAKDHVSYVGNPKLMNGTFSEIPFLLPPLPEQKKIAAILSSVDTVIEKTQAQIDKLNDLKTAMMQELLTKGVGDEHGNPHTEFKDSPVGRIPAGWEVRDLGELAKFNSGNAFKTKDLSEHGLKIIRISNLHKPNFPYWYFDGDIKDTWLVEDGDILFSWAGVANSINVHQYNGQRALLNQHIYNFKFENDELKIWTFQILKSLLPQLKKSIEGGAGQLHLTKAFIQSIAIILPPICERTKIIESLSAIDKRINLKATKLMLLSDQKKALMQDLLTGKVRVKVDA